MQKKPVSKNKIREIIQHQKDIETWKNKEWYSIRAALGNTWAWFYVLLGGREAGKSYSVTEFFVRQWVINKIPFTWLRLTEASTKKLLANDGAKLIDADIRRRYKLDLKVKGDTVYDGVKQMCKVLALSTFYNDKGTALFDKDFLNQISPTGHKMYYHICLDEFQKEKNEKSQGDVGYQFANQMENLIRSTKERMRIFLIGNTLEEAADILTMFNFVPEEFGRYKIKAKKCFIDYMEPTDAYKKRREGTIGDILAGNTSNFTNQINIDTTRIRKDRLIHPTAIIHFTKTDKFTVWDGGVIAVWNREKCRTNLAMRPYLDMLFDQTIRDQIIEQFDTRSFYYHNLISQKKFQKEIRLIKPRKQ